MAQTVIVVVNLWVGVPFTVLSCTGILMNIPSDLYEAAKIDGANPLKMFGKITFPYMMFVLGPSMITSFVGNINNFNIIFLLSGGASGNSPNAGLVASAGDLDLLITWLYKMTVDKSDYDMASVIGILLFVVISFFSLIAYSRIGSVKNEESFQ
jgi:arabinogalactan oligomer/maltooligosaccharide transport system permease protein